MTTGNQQIQEFKDGVTLSVEELVRRRSQAGLLGLSPKAQVRSRQVGGYISPFRGRGVDFEEVRPYHPGDDVRAIDWWVTARTGKTHTKIFREERERPVLIAVDQGSAMRFGARQAFKSVMAAHAAALLAWGFADQGDRVGGMAFTESNHREQAPRSRRAGVLNLIRLLVTMNASNPAEGANGSKRHTGIDGALARLLHVARPGSAIFLLSDFSELTHQGEEYLLRLTRHNDLGLVFLSDPMEERLPEGGRFRFTDGVQFAWGNAREKGAAFQREHAAHRARLQDLALRARGLFIPLSTADNPIDALVEGLRRGGAA